MEASERNHEGQSLTDKDCQIFTKAYRTACELYYQNTSKSSYLESLIHLTDIIPQIVENKAQANAMVIVSQMEILKVKAKNQMSLKQKIDKAVDHLKRPFKEKLNPQLLLELLRNNELFSIGCILAIRLFLQLSKSNEVEYKLILEAIGNNFLVNPTLGVQILQLLCNNNQQNCRLAVREGIVKTLFLNYIPQVLKDKLLLYKCIKLIKTISQAQRSILREREKILSIIIYTYDEYIPIVSDICFKCYDVQYCLQINQKIANQTIDQLYLWSFTQPFCKQVLSANFIQQIFETIRSKKQFAQIESKIYAILCNYCKFCEYSKNDFLKILPKNQESLLNYLKMCNSLVRLNPNSIQLIDWVALDKIMISNSNGKVIQLHKILKQMIGRNVQVGTISNSIKSIFSWQKHADLMNERITKTPKNNADLQDISHILKQNPQKGASQFDQDTLQMMKQKAVDSLHTAISQKHKLNLNPLIDQWETTSVQLLSKFLQIVELNLMMNQQAGADIDTDKILKLLKWLQDNYNGEIVDWGCVLQILAILLQPNEWLQHLKQIPNQCFWLLQIDSLTVKNEKLLLAAIDEASKYPNIRKLALMIGFLGKSLQNQQKIKIIKNNKALFQRMKNQMLNGNNYKLNLMMLSYFLKGWYLQESQKNYQANNKQFEQIISPLVDVVVSNYKALPQEHYFLESCLPFKIHPHSLTKNIEQLINTHGKLAYYLYQNQPKAKGTIAANRFNTISHLPQTTLNQNLKFLTQIPQIANSQQVQKLIRRIKQNKESFWNLYPNYVNIVSYLIGLMEKSSQKSHLTDNVINMIQQVQQNKNIQKEEREDLLYEIRDALQTLQKRGAYIEIERVRKTVTKIIEEEVKEEIIYILNNYQIKEDAPNKVQQQTKQQKIAAVYVKQYESINNKKMNNMSQKQKLTISIPKEEDLIMQANLQSYVNNQIMSKPIEAPSEKVAESIESQFQTVKYQSIKKNHFDALEMLKRIVDKKEPTAKFNDIYQILSTSMFNEVQKELHGSLLAQFYPMEFQQRALTLLLDKQRTTLPKDLFEQLVRRHIHAFKLVRRWKFESRQALDISMLRIKQGYLNDACIVSTYNLTKSSEVQYFYTKKHHLIIIEVLSKVLTQDEIANYLTLIGTVSKLPQIKQEFISHKMHTKIMPLNTLFPLSVKVNSALCYALSTLSFQEAQVCSQIVAQKQQLSIIYGCMRAQPANKTINEPGVCLIANLSYSNNQLKQILRQRKTIQLLLLIFEANLVTPQSSIYKQLLRSIGNLSMNKLCTEQILQGHFCNLAIQLAENLDFFVFYDDKKARVMKLLINLISNLASHKTKMEIMHKQKVTLLIVTMLQTTEKNSQLLAGCIDTIDALCQSNQIQYYMISQKRLMLILMDILKLQEQLSIVLKTGRLVSNLSIHSQCIPFILKSNILSVIGNVVVPNLYIGCMSQEQSKKMEGYVLKILTRVFQSKPQLQLVLKSGYLDCLVRTIELIQVDETHHQILFFYSNHLPNFLNKRAFSCLIKTLTKKIDSKVMIEKCIVSFKNLLTFSYNREDEDEVIEDVPRTYQKIFRSEYLVDGLFLLVYHLLRSHSLRKCLMKRQDKVIEMIQNLGKEEIYEDISRSILFLIHNPITPLWIDICSPHQNQEYFKILKKGFKVRLYRADGSHKHAKIDIDDEYNIRVYKYPDGQIKKKYFLNINHIRDLQIDFRDKDNLWQHTVFYMEKSFLQSHVPDKKLCVTLIGSSRWGEVKLINFEFSNEQQKLFFYQCLSNLISLFKT